jgi:SAM-dependent methyltransferase
MKKQVEKEHYDFSRYMSKKRWCSVWHQLDEVLKLQPERVLEVGPGPGLFKSVAQSFGLTIVTLDIAEDLCPDIVASATNIPAADDSYDVVCSFQMLEHLPFEMSLDAFHEMARVAKSHIIISLPDAEVRWPYSFYVPKIGSKTVLLKRPRLKVRDHEFDGEHYWEVNKKGFELEFILSNLLSFAEEFSLTKTYRVPENPYHRFFVFDRK